MRLLVAILVVALLAVQARLWLSDQGLAELYRLHAAVAEQRQENDELRRRNEALAAEVENLREGIEAAEERARSDLGLVRDDETFFQVVPPERARRSDPPSVNRP